MKTVSKLIAQIALLTAKSAAGSASQWCQCQPKEPHNLKDMISK